MYEQDNDDHVGSDSCLVVESVANEQVVVASDVSSERNRWMKNGAK